MNRTIVRLTAALSLTAAIGMYAQDSNACGGGFAIDPELELRWREQGIASAEKQLEKGEYDNAAATVLRVIPHIGNYAKAPTKDTVAQRAMHVLAVATARKDGNLNVSKQVPDWAHDFVAKSFLNKKDGDRTANLEWAVKTLESIQTVKKDDAVVGSELGEAMAKLDGRKDDARRMLEKLAGKDLLASPEAYRALADLRADAGDAGGRTAALERCKAMAKDAAMCTARAAGRS